jgi:hypothetical protein
MPVDPKSFRDAAVKHVTNCSVCQSHREEDVMNGAVQIIYPFATMCPQGRELYDTYAAEVYK